MTIDREQIRLNAERLRAHALEHRTGNFPIVRSKELGNLAEACLTLLDELEQAEKERDQALNDLEDAWSRQ